MQATFDDATRTRNGLEDRKEALRGAVLTHRKAIRGLEASELHRNLNEAKQKHAALKEAKRSWQHIVQGYQQIDNLRADIERHTRKLDQFKNDHRRVEGEEMMLRERFLQLERAYTLSQISEIKKLAPRTQRGHALSRLRKRPPSLSHRGGAVFRRDTNTTRTRVQRRQGQL